MHKRAASVKLGQFLSSEIRYWLFAGECNCRIQAESWRGKGTDLAPCRRRSSHLLRWTVEENGPSSVVGPRLKGSEPELAFKQPHAVFAVNSFKTFELSN